MQNIILKNITNNIIIYAICATQIDTFIPLEVEENLIQVIIEEEFPVGFNMGVPYLWVHQNDSITYNETLSSEDHRYSRILNTRCEQLCRLYERVLEEQRLISKFPLPLQSKVYALKLQEATDYMAAFAVINGASSTSLDSSTTYPFISGVATPRGISFETAAKLILFMGEESDKELIDIEVRRESEKLLIMNSEFGL